jgi:hypothetical protein
MKNITSVFVGVGAVLAVLIVAGFLVIKPVLAQVADAISSSTASTSAEAVIADGAIPDATTTPPAADTGPATVATSTSEEVSATAASTADPTTDAPEAATSTVALVEVKLDCKFSYMATVYDTPSGKLDEGYYLDAVPATTTGQVAHAIGQQAWTECSDKAGNVHTFQLTNEEYAALALPGSSAPRKSVMEPADQPASPSVPDASASTTPSDDSGTSTVEDDQAGSL